MVTQRYIVQFSGGVSSWAAARRLVNEHGPDAVLLLSANTNSEAPDWLPFVRACRDNLGCELIMLDNDGKTIWDVFHENRFLGNSRIDLCSRLLKREPLLRWIEANCDPEFHRIVIGFDFEETGRIAKANKRWAPWTVVYPLTEEPLLFKEDMLDMLKANGIEEPRAYREGFSHNNCNATCVKAGQAHWARLLETRPGDYRAAEAEEEKLRAELGNVSILVDRKDLAPGEKRRPLTLADFRRRLGVDDHDFDTEDWGSCSCMEQ